MVAIPIVRPALKDNIVKLESEFFNGYRNGDRVLYISSINFIRDFQFMDDEVRTIWSPN